MIVACPFAGIDEKQPIAVRHPVLPRVVVAKVRAIVPQPFVRSFKLQTILADRNVSPPLASTSSGPTAMSVSQPSASMRKRHVIGRALACAPNSAGRRDASTLRKASCHADLVLERVRGFELPAFSLGM
jgi:hypothetical protein